MPRKAAPWWRTAAGRWYVLHNGRQTPLPVVDRNDLAGAFEAFKRLVDAANATSTACRREPIAELVAPYLDSISHRVTVKTRLDYASHLRRLVARFGSVQAGQLDAATLEKSADPAWSDSHKSNYLWTVQAFLRWAGCTGLKLARPAKESRGADAVISPEVHARVLRETTGDFHQLCRFLWCVGCRPMEAAGLTVEGVDMATGTATLKRHKTKHKGRQRILYLSSEALSIIQEQTQRHKTGHLFRGQGGSPFTRQAIVTRFIRMRDKIGKPVTAYQYRHTFCHRALAAGAPDTHVAALMGHINTTMIHAHYAHVHANGRLLREVADSLSRAAG